MLQVWVILTVVTSLFQCLHGSVELEQIQPEPGDPICLGEEVAYLCEVVGNQLFWTFEGQNGSSETFFPGTPIGVKGELGSFTVILENRTSNGEIGYVFTSEAKSTHGLISTDIGKNIYCGNVNDASSILITVSEPEIENASYCLNTISWSPPPCDAYCTVSVNGQDIDTVPCGDGNLTSANDPDLNTENVNITAVDEVGNVVMVQASPAKDCKQPTHVTMTNSTVDSSATAAPTSGNNTTVIIVTVIVILVVAVVVVMIVMFFCVWYYLKGRKNIQLSMQYHKQSATKESLILEFEKTTNNCHEHPITHCVISPDAKFVVTADTDPVVKLWEPNNQNELLCKKVLNREKIEEELKHPEKKTIASFKRQLLLSLDWLRSGDGDRQLCLAYDNCVVVWNMTKDKVSKIHEPERNFGVWNGYNRTSIICAACTYFGPTYAISFTKDIDEQSLLGSLILKKMTWPIDQQMKILCEGGDLVVSMSIGSEGKILVTGSTTGLLQIYNIHHCDVGCLQSVRCSGSIWEIQFCSADAKNMCCLVDGKEIYFWSRSTEKLPTKMVDSIACQSPLLPWLGGIAKHPVTKRNKLFGSFCANRYILVNSDGTKKVLYKVDYDSASKAISPLSDDPFSCLDCVTHDDTTTCVMAPPVPEEQSNHTLTLFRLKYEPPATVADGGEQRCALEKMEVIQPTVEVSSGQGGSEQDVQSTTTL